MKSRNLTNKNIKNMGKTVTFETKVWEKDWEYILKGNYLEKVINSCNYNFDKKTIIINQCKRQEKS